MATSAPPQSECEGPEAADLAQLMLMSRQNYARWHSYELHVSTAQSPHVRPCPGCRLEESAPALAAQLVELASADRPDSASGLHQPASLLRTRPAEARVQPRGAAVQTAQAAQIASSSRPACSGLGGLQGHEFSRAALLHKLLRETPSSEVEWILYMDPQTLFDQPTYVFNFEFYAGRDLVLSCNIWEVKSGDTGGLFSSGSIVWQSKARFLAVCSCMPSLSHNLQESPGSGLVAAAQCARRA